jgi:alpha-galactosidase/6-phospho-beta-glucosidase family protein
LATLGRANPDTIRGFALASCREIYQRTMTIGDFANALRAIKLLWDLAAIETD